MYLSSLKRISIARETARERKYDEEVLEGKLRGDAYKLFKLSMETKAMFDDYESKEYLGLLFKGKALVLYLADNGIKKKIWKSSPFSTKSKTVITSLKISAEENFIEKSVDIDEFKIRVAKELPGLYPGGVGSILRRRWLRENIYKIEDEKIQLIHPLKEVLVF